MTTTINKKGGKLDLGERYFEQTASAAMKNDLIRGLVELITNCDDSYSRLEDKSMKPDGLIQISVKRKQKSKTIVKILDHAEGMTLEDMKEKLKKAGGLTSGFMESDGKYRGLMGRGSKECVALGNLTFQSIQGFVYSEVKIEQPANFIEVAERPVNEADRVETGIKGNGTLITWKIELSVKIPAHDRLVNDLPNHCSLRDIVASNNGQLIIIDENNKRKDQATFKEIIGDLVFDEVLVVPGYPKAKAHLQIFKVKEKIKVKAGDPYWRGGIIVKSNKANHEVTAFTKDIENNLPYIEYYFGRLSCPFIDNLVVDYEKKRINSEELPSDNPIRIINPLRFGLERTHPFTEALYKEASKYLAVLLKNDENEAKSKIKDIENANTKKQLKKLAIAVSKFLKDNIEDIDSEDEDILTPTEIPSNGMRIVPQGLKIIKGTEQRLYVYVKPISAADERHVELITDSDAIELSSKMLGLVDQGNGLLVNYFVVKGIKEAENIKIKLKWKDIIQEARVSVVFKRDILDIDPFQFEKKNYSVKEGKTKNIKVLAQWPDFVSGRVKLAVKLADEKYCEVVNSTPFLDFNKNEKEKYGRRVATAIIRLKGKNAGGPIVLSAKFGENEIKTKIRVLPVKEQGVDFEIKIVNEDLGDQRAVWSKK